MSHFAVIREAGPGWLDGQDIYEQPEVGDHAAFMNDLAEEGFLLFAGPLGEDNGPFRALLIVKAEEEREISDRLADDPWTRANRLEVVSAEPWKVIVGGTRLEGAA